MLARRAAAARRPHGLRPRRQKRPGLSFAPQRPPLDRPSGRALVPAPGELQFLEQVERLLDAVGACVPAEQVAISVRDIVTSGALRSALRTLSAIGSPRASPKMCSMLRML